MKGKGRSIAALHKTLPSESRQIVAVNREGVQQRGLFGDEVIVDGDDQQAPAVGQIGTKGQPFDLFWKTGTDQPEFRIEQIQKQALLHRLHAVRYALGRQRFVLTDVGGPGELDFVDLLGNGLWPPFAVTFEDQKLVIVDGQNFADPVFRVVERI